MTGDVNVHREEVECLHVILACGSLAERHQSLFLFAPKYEISYRQITY